MASGLPIACSNKGPMLELLQDGGVYFNPEAPHSIAVAIKSLIQDESLRKKCGMRAQKLAMNFSWEKCANETWTYVRNCYRKSLIEKSITA